METQSQESSVNVQQTRNNALAIYIGFITMLVVSYSLVTFVNYV